MAFCPLATSRFGILHVTIWALIIGTAYGDINDTTVCGSISAAISSDSSVIYPWNLGSLVDFAKAVEHWFDTSSQVPACVLEVGSPEDVAAAIKIIGSSRTPFAVKSGGHASNPGFSSTTGVHISLSKFSSVTLSADKTTVEIGFGDDGGDRVWTWADVYDQLEGTGVNVVGGRVPGPGVGGFTLGGGFSWKTNQYGLTCDTLKSYNVVLPNGTISSIDSSYPDLYFALKGGMNRFGVVTSAIYYTQPQVPEIYGGIAIYATSETADVLKATQAFYDNNTDPKAQIITTLNGGPLGNVPLVLFFYDGPDRPAAFTAFDDITVDVSDAKTQSFSEFVGGIPSKLPAVTNFRGTFNTISTSALTAGFLDAVRNESQTLGKSALDHSGNTVAYDIEPFLSTYGELATDSAYPHSKSPLPLNLYYAWASEDDDEYWYAQIRASVERLKAIGRDESIYDDGITQYPNYAIAGTSSKELYGTINAARLARIREAVDPDNVMELAGGFPI